MQISRPRSEISTGIFLKYVYTEKNEIIRVFVKVWLSRTVSKTPILLWHYFNYPLGPLYAMSFNTITMKSIESFFANIFNNVGRTEFIG